MGKRRLRCSIRALQDAIINLKAVVPICIQRSRTHSFRGDDSGDLCASFRSIYYTPPSSSFSSSDSDLSKMDEGIGWLSEQPDPLLRMCPIVSARFFFSPCTTKSIMEEAGARGFCGEEGVAMVVVVASEDPYRDFRASMEEMVEANRVREWPRLQELLHRYLRLNEERTHKVIMLAFLDLIMHHRLSQDGRHLL